MSPIKTIRERLGLTQAALGDAIGVSQGNVGHYEKRGQLVSVPVAAKLIRFCEKRGLTVTFDDLYRHYLRRAPARAVNAAGTRKAAPPRQRRARARADSPT